MIILIPCVGFSLYLSLGPALIILAIVLWTFSSLAKTVWHSGYKMGKIDGKP